MRLFRPLDRQDAASFDGLSDRRLQEGKQPKK